MSYKIIITVLAATAITLSACNTIEGAGQDIKAGGQAMSNAATKTKQKMSQ